MPRRKKVERSWWAERWLAALEALGWESRLSRGRVYAQGGKVRDLTIEPGHVAARVQGTRPVPYRVDVRLPTPADGAWLRAVAALAEHAGLGARLVAGELPEEAVEIFNSAGAALFPTREERIALSCSCSDWVRPCKHAAGVLQVVANELDRNPFVLFALRGRTRDELLAALRAARAAGGSTEATEPASVGAPAEAELSGLASSLGEQVARFWESNGPIPTIALGSDAAVDSQQEPEAQLRRLGPPPRGLGGVELQRELATAYRLLAERARALLARSDRAPAGTTAVSDS